MYVEKSSPFDNLVHILLQLGTFHAHYIDLLLALYEVYKEIAVHITASSQC